MGQSSSRLFILVFFTVSSGFECFFNLPSDVTKLDRDDTTTTRRARHTTKFGENKLVVVTHLHFFFATH